MSTNDIVEHLDGERKVLEFYVLVRQIKVYLDVGHSNFHPPLGIKIYKTRIQGVESFMFDVSHHVHTPEQAGPYHTSITTENSEVAAIDRAISSTTTFIKSAIGVGHEPTEQWLIENKTF